MFQYPHDRQKRQGGFSHMPKQNGYFLRSAIIPSAECRQQNYLVGTPSTPIPHSLHTLSQWEIRQNHLDRFETNTSKPFVCHTWGPQMDSHHTVEVDWKCNLFIPASLSFQILPSSCQPWSAHVVFTKVISPLHTTDMMWCHLINQHISPSVGFLK